ncbi:NADH:ubiquinone oxidoreductase [Tabrizicola sp.]|uniref:NADH:ubiquinone oxidoreductase n=1 Tax=Tabrizicola sp. TaxID=2005166 RepID=UPI0027329FC7|nr:NADH:ubiquinone oxidoreductase [Tabrizicola sp.]MDP3197894.1 NADH:ubiquinone oxidoreductase [Tabrizicola sp.]
MRRAENVNAPSLGGWIIAAAMGLVAFGVLTVIGEFDLTPAVAVAAVVALVAGLIMGMPWGGSAARVAPVAPTAAKPVAAPAAFVATPVAISPEASTDGPARLAAPRGGKADNLKEIEGVGPAMEKLVNEMGFYHFDQIAGWSESDVAWVDANLKGFKGRVTRDRWVAQAKIIVNEGLAAFRERAKTNSY